MCFCAFFTILSNNLNFVRIICFGLFVIKIEKYNPGEEQSIEKLIRIVYDEFVAPDYSEEGNNHFYDFIKPESIVERVNNGNIIFTAKDGKRMRGMIELKNYNHICLLFVDRRYHGLGIARDLFNKIVELVRDNTHVKLIDVHSSPFAVPVYERLGFRVISEMQEMDGIKFVTMEYDIQV